MTDGDVVRITFSAAEHTAEQIVSEAQAGYDLLGALDRTANMLLGAGFQASFRADIEARTADILGWLRALCDESDEAGRDLYTAAQRFREVDAECAALFNGRGSTGGPGAASGQAVTAPGLPPRPAPPPQPATGDGSGVHGAAGDPSWGDKLSRQLWYGVADAADGLGMDDAARHMRHYLDNSGEPLEVDVSEMLGEIPGFQDAVDTTYQNELLGEIDRIIAGQYTGEPMAFQVTTDWNNFYADELSSPNWFFGLGGFSYSYGAEVMVTPGPNGVPQVQVISQMHVFDRYNWDAGKGVRIGVPVPDTALGRLHQVGIAQEYDIWGTSDTATLTYDYTGQTPTSTFDVPTDSGRRR